MKKILGMLAITATIFGACTPTVTPVTVSLSASSANEVGLAASQKQFMVTVTNSSSQSATINWERSETQSVAGWTYSVNGNSGMSGTLTIDAGASKIVTLVIMPNSMAGTGTGKIKFYDAADQNATMKTFTYSLSTVSKMFELVMVDPLGMTRTARTTDNPTANDYHMKVYNPNATTVNVNWILSNNTNNPSSWETYVCDPINCWTPNILMKSFDIAPLDSAEFKITVDHKGNTGIGGATGMIYVPTDSANTVVSQTASLEVN